ncbi:MAG TPA: proline--tRNA ligase [Aggregatilinea sp.]|uniref:proline--tRNA ligase n=1 Tax=Aggregatilinea sp. TaxID=2806333 RepID=UPI002CEAB7D1|nr:proline--tRNA ligase [Aggregatilinea sp.]HML22830.1 proline--tRNA ligase [Aggregatilinea sp.]
MRLSDLFTRTLRDAPSDADLPSHQLAIRAGLVRPVAAGSYAVLPLGRRVMRRIEAIMREEMEALGAQEIVLPVVQPAEVWAASGRLYAFDGVLQGFTSDAGRDFVLAPTGEELVALLAAREVESYKHLPQLVYQIHTKYRNEPRPRGGLIRLREFSMKDAYSLDATVEGLDRVYERILAAYDRIFARVGLEVVPVEADSGAMGGRASTEYMLAHTQGESALVRCDRCDYAASDEAAAFALPQPEPVELDPVCKVATPECKTIQQLADFLGIPASQTLKAVFFVDERPGDTEDEFVFVVIRGDLDVNEAKLLRALGGGTLRAATDDEIRAVGAEPGYASPIGLTREATVIADLSVRAGANFAAGANEAGYHFTGINVPRDFDPARVENIALVYEGALCPRCDGGSLHLDRAIELGHCFKIGTRYSDALNVTYLDERGISQPVIMGSYGIGLERLMAAIIESHHDEHGIVWPASVAPFDVHVVVLGKEPQYADLAAQVVRDLEAAGLSVLLDDRADSPGVKFADADLIGVPLRVTVSKKAAEQGGVEVKRRAEADRRVIPLADVVAWAQSEG